MTPEERAKDIYHAYPALVDSSGEEFMAFCAATIRAAVEAERERIKAEVRAIHADYPADVFPSREGQAARHVAERVLRVIDALS